MKFEAKYGHDEYCTPGVMTIEATDESDAIAQARAFVEDGYRNKTWINLDIGDSAYRATNEHGKAVGGRI
jgi:hypothetical protein